MELFSSATQGRPETLFEMSRRHAEERKQLVDEKKWRRSLLMLGFSMREVLGDLPERVAATPEETNEVRDARRVADQERIQRENAEHRERLANMQPTIDDNTEDDATGEARARAREASDARRREQAAALRQKNREIRARLRSIGAAIDSKIWDDGEGSAGAARSMYAAQSRARKEHQAQMMRQQNSAYASRMRSAHASTGNKIWLDGEGSAGAARPVYAAASRARKEEEANTLRAENSMYYGRLRGVQAATDNGFHDGRAGSKVTPRSAFAAASRARKQQDERTVKTVLTPRSSAGFHAALSGRVRGRE